MYDRVCPDCSRELTHIAGITNFHFTGDEKKIVLYKCEKCKRKFLIISMEASMSYGVNYFAFRIDLNEDEAEKIERLMENCPSPHNENCSCPAHSFLDKFDHQNKDRRVILEDEKEYWR